MMRMLPVARLPRSERLIERNIVAYWRTWTVLLSGFFEPLFYLLSIGVGIAAGVKSLEIAVVLTVFFNYASIAVCAFGDGLESQHVVRRKAERKARKAAKAAAEKETGETT